MMKTSTFHAIGLMSGTSLDGLDICYASFSKNINWNFEILKAETISYDSNWKEKLKNSILLSSEDLLALNSEYGFYLAKHVQNFIEKHHIHNIDVIASHGHTIFHQPERKFTLQIGDGRAIKSLTKIPTVYDFRMQDVLFGGNGAPLVPIGDELLFHEYDACINLGGFSNISFKENQKRIGFDICPVNIILNHFAQQEGFNYDDKGNLAKQGKVNNELLAQLNSLDFYRQKHPKSLGFEWCEDQIFPLLKNKNPLEVLATFTEHISEQISKIINQNLIKKILFTGGGAYNNFLIDKIKYKIQSQVIIPSKNNIEFKEALIFAFMGVLRVNNEINILSSVTGATKDHCSGVLV